MVYKDYPETFFDFANMVPAAQIAICTRLGMLVGEMVNTRLGRASEEYFHFLRASIARLNSQGLMVPWLVENVETMYWRYRYLAAVRRPRGRQEALDILAEQQVDMTGMHESLAISVGAFSV